MSDSLPAELAQFVQSEVAAGHYASEAEVLSAAVRLLRDEQNEAIEGIRRGVASMERGEGVTLDEAIADLKARLRAEA